MSILSHEKMFFYYNRKDRYAVVKLKNLLILLPSKIYSIQIYFILVDKFLIFVKIKFLGCIVLYYV